MALTEQKVLEDKKQVELVCTVGPEDFEKAVQRAFVRENKKIQLPGFRKGKATRQMIERRFGESFFYEDAANDLLPDEYDAALNATEYQVVGRPQVRLDKISKEEGMVVTFTVTLRPELTVGQYKGVSAVKSDVTVSEEEVNAELSRYQKNAARILDVDDRPVEMNDQITLDFEGFVDGKPFEGGKGEDYKLTIGSHSFIDTFEDQIVGHQIGEEFDVNVTFPENYGEKSLAGKPALFKCTVKDIHVEELPELDDELAKDVSEFDTLDELKEDIRKTLAERKEERVNTDFENALMDKIVEGLEGDIPSEMIDEAVDEEVNQFAYQLRYQGIDMDSYFKYTGLNDNYLRETLRASAEKKLRTRLALEAIARAEEITVSDEEVEAEYEKQAKNYQMETEKLRSLLPAKLVKADLACNKALDIVRENGIAEAEPVAEAEEVKEETQE